MSHVARKRLIQENAKRVGLVCEINSPGGPTHFNFYRADAAGRYMSHAKLCRGVGQAEQFLNAVRLGYELAKANGAASI